MVLIGTSCLSSVIEFMMQYIKMTFEDNHVELCLNGSNTWRCGNGIHLNVE